MPAWKAGAAGTAARRAEYGPLPTRLHGRAVVPSRSVRVHPAARLRGLCRLKPALQAGPAERREAPSPSAIPSGPPAPGSWSRSSTRWSAATPATESPPSASAAAWAWRCCSSGRSGFRAPARCRPEAGAPQLPPEVLHLPPLHRAVVLAERAVELVGAVVSGDEIEEVGLRREEDRVERGDRRTTRWVQGGSRPPGRCCRANRCRGPASGCCSRCLPPPASRTGRSDRTAAASGARAGSRTPRR